MKKRFLLFLLFIIFVVSFTNLILILIFLDPYDYKIISIASLLITYTLSISSIFTIIIYFFKKIYFRGKTHIYHILTSFRQSFFIAFYFFSLIFFNYIWASLFLTWILIFLILFFLELFIKNQEE